MRVKTDFGEYDVSMDKLSYRDNGNLAIQLTDKADGCPFAMLTVNLGVKMADDLAYVDTNNCPWAPEFIAENKLGEFMGEWRNSVFCRYPLYKFY